MNRLFILIITLCASANALAGSIIIAVGNNGNWATAATWNLNRAPQNGDTIIIPSGLTLALTTTENLNGVIIKIAGTLNMSGGAKMNLDAAGFIRVQPSGVVSGQGNNDQINIGNAHVFKGGAAPILGPMYADNTTGSGFASYSIMPVTFVNFYVAKDNDQVKIFWSTASESNNDHFELEKSADGANWAVIAIILSAGNSNSIKNYSFVDKKIATNTVYYRIKQVDSDGRATYTAIKSIHTSKEGLSTQIFASTNNDVIVSFDAIQKNVVVKVWNMNGQSMKQQMYNNSAYINLKLNNIVRGIYVVQVTDENNNVQSKKIFLN